MNIKNILLIIIVIYFIFSHCKLLFDLNQNQKHIIEKRNIENFAVSDDIKGAVKEIYNTDMEAVRQLAAMATKLTAGGLEIPGNLTVTGTISGVGTAPIGSIIMWSGNRVTLPSNWKFCDGNTHNGITTPNLVGKFILGANIHQDGSTITSDTFNSKAYNGWNLYSTIEDGGWTITGGSKNAIVVSHGHGVTDPGHNHSFYGSYHDGSPAPKLYLASWAGGPTTNVSTEKTGISIVGTGESGSNKNLPPYYALAYIMRIA